MEKETTNEEVLRAIHDFAELTPTKEDIDLCFRAVCQKIENVDDKLENVKNELKTDIEGI